MIYPPKKGRCQKHGDRHRVGSTCTADALGGQTYDLPSSTSGNHNFSNTNDNDDNDWHRPDRGAEDDPRAGNKRDVTTLKCASAHVPLFLTGSTPQIRDRFIWMLNIAPFRMMIYDYVRRICALPTCRVRGGPSQESSISNLRSGCIVLIRPTDVRPN
jgi:hypothetical protein